MRGKPDYALVRALDRRRVRSCYWVAMRHHDSDHRALILRVEADPAGVKRYDKARRTLPAPPSPARSRWGTRCSRSWRGH